MRWYLLPLKNTRVSADGPGGTEYWQLRWPVLSRQIGSHRDPRRAQSPALYLAYALAVLTPTLAVSVRRLHDTGRSGRWLLGRAWFRWSGGS